MALYNNINGKIVKVSPMEENRINAERNAEKNRRAGIEYRGHRRREYPGLCDQLDALWKIVNHLKLAGVTMPSEGDGMLGRILSVKTKYPKPNEENKND